MDLPIKPLRLFKNMRWHQCYVAWLHEVYSNNSFSERSLYGYQRRMVNFFKDPSRQPDTYAREEVLAFLEKNQDGQASSARTYNARLTTLASWYSFAGVFNVPFRNGERAILHKTAPTYKIKWLQVAHADRDISDAEMERFFAAIPKTLTGKRDRALFLCYLCTARRRAEIARLRWRDIEAVVFAKNRPGYIYTFKGKGRIATEQSELPVPAFDAIKEYLIADGRWDNMRADSAIFPGRKRGATLNLDYISCVFKAYAREAGLPDECCLHSIRHYAAWELYQFNGHDIVAVQKHLGHLSIEQTLEYLERRERREQGNPVVAQLATRYAAF